MRKIVLLFFVVLFMTVPVMATSNVTVTCSKDASDWVMVSFVSDPCRVRAFGIDITLEPNDANILQVEVLDANYRIFPGQIDFLGGDVNDYGTCYDPCDLGDPNLAIEMGTLYTLDPCYAGDPNAGYRTTPPSASGDLLRFKVSANNTSGTLDANTRRGGIVLEDPCETANYSSPLCEWGAVAELDFGDLPDSYLTLLASNGPRHPDSGPMLGASRDIEADGVPGVDARGDDLAGIDDEDGLQFWGGCGVRVTVSAACKLNAWVDWNNDGDFGDTGERVFTNESLSAGAKSFVMTVPGTVVKDTYLYSRWRVTTASLATDITASYGLADDGEVEDYNKPYVSSCYSTGDPQYSDWVANGMPYCWCYPRQCHGDADGKTPQTKPPYQWVTNDDLIILKSGWTKTVDQFAGTDICADFNRKTPQTKPPYQRVTNDDLDILKANWAIGDKPDPNCVPGNTTPATAPPME